MGTKLAGTVTELVADLEKGQALCAINVENLDSLTPTLRAAGNLDCPIVIAWSLPAARYLGFGYCVDLVRMTASRFSVRFALHLDHCDESEAVEEAVRAGFTSINFLDEGGIGSERYMKEAMEMRDRFGGRVSLEFVFGTLPHAHGSNHESGASDDFRVANGSSSVGYAAAIIEFADVTQPDILGFDCGSLHGMETKTQSIDTDLIRHVAGRTGLPVVLHGSSGVRSEEVMQGIDAGVRKINIETAIRRVYMDTIRSSLDGDGPAARKPRYMTMAIDRAVGDAVEGYLRSYTQRR